MSKTTIIFIVLCIGIILYSAYLADTRNIRQDQEIEELKMQIICETFIATTTEPLTQDYSDGTTRNND